MLLCMYILMEVLWGGENIFEVHSGRQQNIFVFRRERGPAKDFKMFSHIDPGHLLINNDWSLTPSQMNTFTILEVTIL